MGCVLSKKKKKNDEKTQLEKKLDPAHEPASSSPPPAAKPPRRQVPAEAAAVVAEKAKKKQLLPAAVRVAASSGSASTVVTDAMEDQEIKKAETPRKSGSGAQTVDRASASPEAQQQRRLPVRASSCTKEELDAILIQCGRLSRSASGNASSEAAAGGRRYSGTKRSYDFDDERRQTEEDGGRPTPKPSPRRRTPGRDRSGSRERGGGGASRRTSRSPARRVLDVPLSSVSQFDKPKQPAKMVSVPPREKGIAIAADDGDAKKVEGARRTTATTAGKKGGASPRSQSPANPARAAGDANAHPSGYQSLSRSSSRKAENSPSRRNPMAEIDENRLGRDHRPPSRPKSQNCSREADPPKAPIQPEIAGETAAERRGVSAPVGRTMSSRRSSRDLDQSPIFCASLLEDIQSYQKNNAATFSLPACVAKACSILEAVADLNSFDGRDGVANRSWPDKAGSFMKTTKEAPLVVESEMFVEDDIVEPSLHRYVTTRSEFSETTTEQPQESAGSNSFVVGGGCPQLPLKAAASLSTEPGSADSTGRCWTSQSSAAGNEHGSLHRLPEKSTLDGRGRRASGGSGGGYSSNYSSLGSAASKKKRVSSDRLQIRNGGGVAVGGGGGLKMDRGGARVFSS